MWILVICSLLIGGLIWIFVKFLISNILISSNECEKTKCNYKTLVTDAPCSNINEDSKLLPTGNPKDDILEAIENSSELEDEELRKNPNEFELDGNLIQTHVEDIKKVPEISEEILENMQKLSRIVSENDAYSCIHRKYDDKNDYNNVDNCSYNENCTIDHLIKNKQTLETIFNDNQRIPNENNIEFNDTGADSNRNHYYSYSQKTMDRMTNSQKIFGGRYANNYRHIHSSEDGSDSDNNSEEIMDNKEEAMLESSDEGMVKNNDEDNIINNEHDSEQYIGGVPDEVRKNIIDANKCPEKLKELGNLEFKNQNFENAIHYYTMALHYTSESNKNLKAVIFANRAACQTHYKQWDYVISDSTCAVESDPNYAKGYLRRFSAYEALEKWHDALNDLNKAIELDPALKEKYYYKQMNIERLSKELFEKEKAEMIGKMKDFGNYLLGKVGLSLDNFKLDQNPETGSYNIQFQQNVSK